MNENLDFLNSPEWKEPWTTSVSERSKTTAAVAANNSHHHPHHQHAQQQAVYLLNDDSDDSVLERLHIPDDDADAAVCQIRRSASTKSDLDDASSPLQDTSGNSDEPEHSCMNMGLLLNTEAFADFSSPMPPPPVPNNFTIKRRAIEIDTTPVRSATQSLMAKRRHVVAATCNNSHNPPVASDWDECDENAGDFFRTQFLKQYDSLSGGDDNGGTADRSLQTANITQHQVGLSQFFQASQFVRDTQPATATPVVVPIQSAPAPASDDDEVGTVRFTEDEAPGSSSRAALVTRIAASDLEPGLTQLLSSSPDRNNAELPPSTQRFLRDVQNVIHDARSITTTTAATQAMMAPQTGVAIYTNAEHATAYIEMQRAMSELNDANIGDDNFVDPDLSQAYKSTQYRREVEAVFSECERSLCERPLPSAATEAVDVHGLDGLNWTQTDFSRTPAKAAGVSAAVEPSPLKTPSVFVRKRLEELKRVVTPKSALNEGVGVRRTPSNTSITTGFTGLGPFYGLPLRVKSLIKDYKGISELYDWQKQCLSLPAIARRSNLIYALPTSGGKTLVSEILILREVLCRRRNCLFILPYVSIVQEKMWSLSPFAVELDFLLEEYAAGKGQLPPLQRRKKRSIYIATIEKGLALLDSLIEARRAHELGLIVVDELHIIGEPGRGATLETLLTKAMFIEAGIQIVGMSATIGNIPELAQFLSADVFTRDFRPVELREYIKCGTDLLQINDTPGGGAKSFDFVRTVEFNYRDDVRRRDPDHLAGLVSEVIPEQSVLVFCPTKLNCENVALLLSQLLPEKYLLHKQAQRTELRSFLEKDGGGALCRTLARTIPYGIAYHHSGLTGDERRLLEDAFRQNILCVICCTSTLAAGVNLPAKRVILRSPYVGREFITLSRYKQMVGRAGRAGLCGDVGESILICGPRDNERVGRLLCSPMDEAASSLAADGAQGVQALLLSAVGLGLAVSRTEMEALLGKTLMSVQAQRLGVDVAQVTSGILNNLFRMKTLQVADDEATTSASTTLSATSQSDASCEFFIDASNSSLSESLQSSPLDIDPKTTVRHIRLKPSTRLSINCLGRAAFKSGFGVRKSRTVYRDLQKAQRSLVLSTHLHLLYVVTPYEAADVNVRPSPDLYYARLVRLTRDQQLVARTLGIGEQVQLRIRGEQEVRPAALQRIVGRFFMTLMLNELWEQRSVHEVAAAFAVSRGVVQSLVVAAASYASGVLKCCDELEDFWAMRELLRMLTKRLSYCCTAELVPLMDLPCVKVARAKQLYAAGFRSLEHVARADVRQLTEAVEHLNGRLAKQLIASAKVLLLEKVESLREEVQDCLEVLEGKAVEEQT